MEEGTEPEGSGSEDIDDEAGELYVNGSAGGLWRVPKNSFFVQFKGFGKEDKNQFYVSMLHG